ncbi:MAG: hypothetical protein ACYSW7_06860 [Planctomycetota bacterium]
MVTSDGVDTGHSQTPCNIRGIGVAGQICPKRKVYTPKPDALSIAIEVPGPRTA